ncbi:deoxyguanosinetriphosphate triphosphohydrolase family protein [Couchioplanes caeruleus]|uniref:dGTPase n=1 Tax=Couchioplanes caeruleus TaxID=56438 RepID=A0A3N1GM30_9ACTN|nr:dNTP triphosphohydrolase [Couchioplanes caeruleus]ROP31278.1 dGTPase [Couchioplanes caeruleus]
MDSSVPRHERRSKYSKKSDDTRTEFRRDRDRLIYSQAFRRLAGITQVVAPQEGQTLHNRLIHSIKVGQVSRGIAEHLAESGFKEAKPFLDPDVAEFAGMAHDLGHPPFGHAAEKELQELMSSLNTDSFEGNAQTFRILSRLCGSYDGRSYGLDLTRASLQATLKYPYFRIVDHREAGRKWSVYRGDRDAFEWCCGEAFVSQIDATAVLPPSNLEAQVMDWADDITYAVHDIEDFARIDVVPLDEMITEGEAWACFSDWMRSKWNMLGWQNADQALEGALACLQAHLPIEQYRRRVERDRLLSGFVANMVHDCIVQTKLKESGAARGFWGLKLKAGREAGSWELIRPPQLKLSVKALKEMVWYFVIDGPGLKSSQVGQRRAVRTIYEYFLEEATRITQGFSHVNLPPATQRSALVLKKKGVPIDAPRIACDALCELSELQASRLYSRLMGVHLGQSDLFSEPQEVGWFHR